MQIPYNYQNKMGKKTIVNNKKQCRLCNEWLDINNFGRFLDKSGKRYINSRCRKCASAVNKVWNENNKDRRKDSRKIWKEKLYNEFYKMYGNKCACCGETEKKFLTIDHINNDGHIERSINKNSVLKLIRESLLFKRNDIQVLCWNCNCGKQRNNGICPHKQ